MLLRKGKYYNNIITFIKYSKHVVVSGFNCSSSIKHNKPTVHQADSISAWDQRQWIERHSYQQLTKLMDTDTSHDIFQLNIVRLNTVIAKITVEILFLTIARSINGHGGVHIRVNQRKFPWNHIFRSTQSAMISSLDKQVARLSLGDARTIIKQVGFTFIGPTDEPERPHKILTPKLLNDWEREAHCLYTWATLPTISP